MRPSEKICLYVPTQNLILMRNCSTMPLHCVKPELASLTKLWHRIKRERRVHGLPYPTDSTKERTTMMR